MSRAKAATPEAAAAPEPGPLPAPATPAAPPGWLPVDGTARSVRAGLLTLAVVMLAVGCVVAVYAALQIASVWFEPRWVPVAQLAVAGVVIVACVTALRRLR